MLDPGCAIDVALAVWFAFVPLSDIYVPWDAFTRNPELRVASASSVNGAAPMGISERMRETRSPIVAVALLTLVALGSGVLVSAPYSDFAMRAGASMQMPR